MYKKTVYSSIIFVVAWKLFEVRQPQILSVTVVNIKREEVLWLFTVDNHAF